MSENPVLHPLDLLPAFKNPPVVEVAIGVQFRPLFGLRPIELASLREQWRGEFPLVQEQPVIPPVIESPQGAAPGVQFVFGASMPSRLWFLTQDQSALLQLQQDRFTVNWRQVADQLPYPRYPVVRSRFVDRFRDLHTFVQSNDIGSIDINQVEVTYINAIQLQTDESSQIDLIFRGWQPVVEHHLGAPIQTQAALVYTVSESSLNPVRMYVSISPGQRLGGNPAVLLTFTVRGAPGEPTTESALDLMDQAHGHIVQSFVELTPDSMHQRWGITR